MISWVMSLYIFSGLLMLLGVYFTIRYRPYCTLKSPERELAMELHRKQLLDEPMSDDAKLQLDLYLSQTKRYSIWQFIILISVIPHILISIGEFNALSFSPYLLSILCVLPLIVIRPYMLPFCYRTFPASILWKFNDEYLEKLNVYHKKRYGKQLDITESNIYTSQEFSLKMFFFYRSISNFGIVLHLFLDVFFVLNRSSIIN